MAVQGACRHSFFCLSNGKNRGQAKTTLRGLQGGGCWWPPDNLSQTNTASWGLTFSTVGPGVALGASAFQVKPRLVTASSRATGATIVYAFLVIAAAAAAGANPGGGVCKRQRQRHSIQHDAAQTANQAPFQLCPTGSLQVRWHTAKERVAVQVQIAGRGGGNVCGLRRPVVHLQSSK